MGEPSRETMSEGEQKPDVANTEQGDSNPDQINIKVKGPDGAEVFFKIKRKTQMKKLMDAYCYRSGQDPKSIHFLFEGERIQPTQTPDELDMDDGDVIDAMLMQVGGHGARSTI